MERLRTQSYRVGAQVRGNIATLCGKQAPVAIAAAILLVFLSSPFVKGLVALDYRWFRRGRPEEMLLAALPWLLLLTFVFSPIVSSSAFRAFSCEDFDNGQSFLRADYAIECYTEDYARVTLLAWLGILLFPVGVSVLYAGEY